MSEVADRTLYPCVPQVDMNSWVSYSLPTFLTSQHTYLLVFAHVFLRIQHAFHIQPIKSCRLWRHFSPQMRVNQFVFLNLLMLSLEDHLGVTTSPQSPFPTGYITLRVCRKLLPLRLYYSVANNNHQLLNSLLEI